ncbi:unnamed protein product [Symbiodinium sp. KB8]|nr:unnamed protein product [Symbiodinium sp. KB8]
MDYKEAVAEEVKRQVRLALEERESTTKKLEEENQQLRELVQFIDAGNQAEVNRGEGPLPLPRQGGNESGEGSNPAGDLRYLEGKEAQSMFGLPMDFQCNLRSVGEGGPQKPSTSGEGVYSAQTGGNLGERDVGQVDGHKSVQEPSGVDFQAGGTSFAQNADGQNRSKVVGDEDAMVGHLHLLVQGMRQLQQLQISKKDVAEAETMKGNIELPPMPEPGDAAVEFNDWLYEAEQMLGALTDSASTLLSESLRCAREAYDHYQRASAMDRLTIVPVLTATLKDKKWYRLERRVLTLLLSAMPRSVKEDTITHRVENVTSVLYRLHVLYQPGATAERTAILGHLSGASGTEDPTEVVAKLRKWRRYLARADEMGIAAPDASILLKGLDLTLQKVLERQLLQEANSMLSKIKLMGMKVDGVDSAREDLELFFLAAGATDERMALLDSGASHPFRQAVSELELQQAKDVSVELADGQKVDLLQTRTGTLLNDRALDQSPIVPLGSLVQQLGCTVNWSRRQGLRVNHPVHGDIAVRMRGNCPMIDELEALKLISEIEEKNLAQLREATAKGLWRQLSPTGSTWESNLDSYVATGERSQALSALMDPAFPLMMSTATDRFSFVGPTNLDLSDEAGTNYLKALPVNRKTRRRLHQTRWIVHLYDGKNQTTATYLRQLESETTTVLEIDLQRSKILNMKGWNNVIRALLWAACRGQVEGVIGGPHRDDQDELKKKLMYLWMVAEQGAKKDGLRKPFLFMELPENHSWWAAEPWRKLKDEFQLFNVKVGQGDDKGFYGATNMCFSGNKPPSNRSPSQWTEALVSEIKEAVEQWFKHPDQLRMAQLLCAMNGSLGEMSEAELKKWTKHVRNGHVPFDKRPLRTRGVDADGKYRYALIGSYCLPKIEGYKDIDIPEDPEDDGAGVGDVLDDERNFLEEEETVDPPNSIEDQHDLDRRNEDYKRFYKEVYKEVGDSMEKLYLSLRQEGHPVVRVHSDRARELKSASLRQWLYEKDIWVTTGESQAPQQNGRAEAAVKLLKRYAKVLLDAGGLPRECWPLAMSYAAHRQRQRALGQPCNDPPFGAKVAVKSKVFGTGGSYDLDPRWREGKFVGRSSDVTNGLVVRYEDGSFVTSCHVRQGLVDADAIVEPEPVEVELPAPSRRLREKVRLAAIQDRYEEFESYAREMMAAEAYREEDVLNLWTMLKELPRPRRRGLKMADIGERAESFYTGSYVHGGVCGVMKMTRRMPSTTMYLVKAAKELTGINEFGCVAIVEDVGMKAHKDSHNEHSTRNSVTALTEFEDGQIWVEKREEEFQYDDEWKQVRPD